MSTLRVPTLDQQRTSRTPPTPPPSRAPNPERTSNCISAQTHHYPLQEFQGSVGEHPLPQTRPQDFENVLVLHQEPHSTLLPKNGGKTSPSYPHRAARNVKCHRITSWGWLSPQAQRAILRQRGLLLAPKKFSRSKSITLCRRQPSVRAPKVTSDRDMHSVPADPENTPWCLMSPKGWENPCRQVV